MKDSSAEISIQKELTVGSGSLVDYLHGITIGESEALKIGQSDFEKNISIPDQITTVIKEVYENKKTGISRGELTARLDSMLFDQKTPVNREAKMNKLDAELEQARVVYLDVDHNIKATQPVYGEETIVSAGEVIVEAVMQGGVPIVAMHTHDEQAYLSYFDYAPLVCGNSAKKFRYAGSVLVLCPGLQILAVATKDTPIMPNNDAFSLFKERARETIKKRNQTIVDLDDKLKPLSQRKAVVDIVNILQNMPDGKLPREDVERIINMHQVKPGESEQLDRDIRQAGENTLIDRNRFENGDLVNFSREMGVKMYFSNNMRDFKEFSA